MKACWYDRTGPAADVMVVGELPDPQPGEGEVRVRVHYSAVNPSDVKHRDGYKGRRMAFPRVVPHQDGAGVIDQVGPGVDAGRIGQPVWLYMAQRHRPHGTAAEYCVVPASRAVPLPGARHLQHGACLGVPAMTAHRAIHVQGGVAGKTVLVQGGGGAVGFYAIQCARLGGARQVLATVSRDEQAEQARAAGADHVIRYPEVSVPDAVEALMGHQGIDHIVEVDLARNVADDARMLAPHGVIAAYASDSHDAPALPFAALLTKNVSISCILVYDMPAAAFAHAEHDITQWLAADRLVPPPMALLPITEIVALHEQMASGRTVGKLMLSLA